MSGGDALAHARQLLARSAAANVPALWPAAGGPGLIRFPMNCSVHVRPFVVVAEAHGDKLTMRRNETVPAGGHGGGPAAPPPSLGSFSFDMADWPGCPHCGARANFWKCGMCGGFNCIGNRRGRFRCACGTIANSFHTVEKLEVHGVRAGAATPPRAVPPPSAGAPGPAPFVAPPAPPPWRFAPGPSLPAPPVPPPPRLPGRK